MLFYLFLLLLLGYLLGVQKFNDVIDVIQLHFKFNKLTLVRISFSRNYHVFSLQISHSPLFSILLLLLPVDVRRWEVRKVIEFKKSWVDRVPQECRRRPVNENSSQMGIALSTLASLVNRFVNRRFVLCPHLINLVKNDLFIFSDDSALDSPPKWGIACLSLIFMIKGEQPRITHNAMIKSSRHLIP